MKKLKRLIRGKPSAILSADWHIRASKPVCRTDTFLIAQESKVEFIVELAKKYECPILVSGDLGNNPQWANWLLRWFIWITEGVDIITIPGQHDLPNHRLEDVEKSGIGVLGESKTIKLIGTQQREIPEIIGVANHWVVPFPFGCPISTIEYEKPDEPMVAMTHQMIIEDQSLWDGQIAPSGHSILKKFPEYKLILSGDNHNPFVSKYKGRLLVNPGPIMRTTADQIDYKPRVYLWYADTNTVKPVFLPIEEGVVSRDHIDIEEERDTIMEAYVSHMATDYEIGFSYEVNLERHIEANEIDDEVADRAWEFTAS